MSKAKTKGGSCSVAILGNSLLSSDPAHRVPWHAPDSRIRTQSAARRAGELAEWSTNGRGQNAELDEHELFIALHTCAFRIARCVRVKSTTADELESWSKRWRDIRECIVKRNLGLVYVMLGHIRSPDPDQEGRVSDAMYGLARAVERFNPWRGFRFSTYACNVIGRALMRRARREVRHRALFPVQRDAYMECPTRPPDSGVGLWCERLRDTLDKNSGELTDLEVRVLAYRFLSQEERGLTFREIGNDVGLSKERVRQIQNMGLQKLRTCLEVDSILK